MCASAAAGEAQTVLTGRDRPPCPHAQGPRAISGKAPLRVDGVRTCHGVLGGFGTRHETFRCRCHVDATRPFQVGARIPTCSGHCRGICGRWFRQRGATCGKWLGGFWGHGRAPRRRGLGTQGSRAVSRDRGGAWCQLFTLPALPTTVCNWMAQLWQIFSSGASHVGTIPLWSPSTQGWHCRGQYNSRSPVRRLWHNLFVEQLSEPDQCAVEI